VRRWFGHVPAGSCQVSPLGSSVSASFGPQLPCA
jgi:hypothetical protein